MKKNIQRIGATLIGFTGDRGIRTPLSGPGPVICITPAVRGTWSHLPASDLSTFFAHIAASRLTGSLTIHFSEGSPSGMLEWKQKE